MPRIFADERALRQICLNLLSNAIKFTDRRRVRIRVGWTGGGGQYIAVKDNGPGIPADEIPVVLAAFGQGSIAIKSAEQGTGLGLPIVQGLAQLHGGSFELRSKLREGTDAIVTFPAARVMEELPAMPMRKAPAPDNQFTGCPAARGDVSVAVLIMERRRLRSRRRPSGQAPAAARCRAATRPTPTSPPRYRRPCNERSHPRRAP